MIIKLEQGYLKGGEDCSLTTGRKFCTFYGIPYAEPPVGELRFRPPIPAGKWSGVRDAKQPRDWCIQNDMITGETVGSEDCLFVNVFTPEFPDSGTPLKPVMVHFCGGAYIYANEGIIGSFDHLADYDVIMVTLSYRLNIFGYFNLNTSSCAGNCGCKDIIVGLKWIKDNIRVFGGDPNNVTVYGESAGASTVNFLSLSPMAKGLFEKAIISAGTALTPWAFNDDQVDAGFGVGRLLGFTGTDVEELAAFLRQQSAVALKDAAAKQLEIFRKTHPFSIDLLFTPSREKFAEGAFLCDHPTNLIKTAQPVPTIAGVAEKEGVVIALALENGEHLMRLKDDLTDAIKFNQIDCETSDIPKIVEEARVFYLHNAKTDRKIESRLLDFYSDFLNIKFYESFEYVIKSKEPLYVFEFAYIGNLNESKLWTPGFVGCYAGHVDENNYVNLCRGYFPNPRVNDADKEMIRKMCTFYTNFARTGNPNPDPTGQVEWKPHTEKNPTYLRINSKSEMVSGEIFGKGRAFWKYIWRNYVRG